MVKHAINVWKKYVHNSGFGKIHIIAHSAGGSCLRAIQKIFASRFYAQVGKIALTDSWVISADELTKS